LSSARAVRCSVKSGNERNPYQVLNFSLETAQLITHFVRSQKLKVHKVRKAFCLIDFRLYDFKDYALEARCELGGRWG